MSPLIRYNNSKVYIAFLLLVFMKRDLIIKQTGYELPRVPWVIARYIVSKLPVDGVIYHDNFYRGAKNSVNPEVVFVGNYSGDREIDNSELFALRRGIEAMFGVNKFPEHIVTPNRAKGLNNLALYTAILKGFPHPSDVVGDKKVA